MSKELLDQELKFRAEAEMVQALDEVVRSRPAGIKRSQILREAVPAEIPVVEHFGFGHENRNLTFIHGLPHALDATSGHATIRPFLP